jgi:hypothetical protein
LNGVTSHDSQSPPWYKFCHTPGLFSTWHLSPPNALLNFIIMPLIYCVSFYEHVSIPETKVLVVCPHLSESLWIKPSI